MPGFICGGVHSPPCCSIPYTIALPAGTCRPTASNGVPSRQALADPIDRGALSAGARLPVPSTGTSAQQVDSVTDAPSLNRSVVLCSQRSVGRRGECGARGRCYRRKTLFLSCFPLCAAFSVITDEENDRKRCARRRVRQKTLHSGAWMTERAPAGCVDDMGSMPRRA